MRGSEMLAWVAVDPEDDQEGIISHPLMGPLLGTDMRRAEDLKPYAIEWGRRQTNMSMQLKRFRLVPSHVDGSPLWTATGDPATGNPNTLDAFSGRLTLTPKVQVDPRVQDVIAEGDPAVFVHWSRFDVAGDFLTPAKAEEMAGRLLAAARDARAGVDRRGNALGY